MFQALKSEIFWFEPVRNMYNAEKTAEPIQFFFFKLSNTVCCIFPWLETPFIKTKKLTTFYYILEENNTTKQQDKWHPQSHIRFPVCSSNGKNDYPVDR